MKSFPGMTLERRPSSRTIIFDICIFYALFRLVKVDSRGMLLLVKTGTTMNDPSTNFPR